jgi:hypothetical protein
MQLKHASNTKSLPARPWLRFALYSRAPLAPAAGLPAWATIPSTGDADCYTSRIMHVLAACYRLKNLISSAK